MLQLYSDGAFENNKIGIALSEAWARQITSGN
jgi:hypothetical protein